MLVKIFLPCLWECFECFFDCAYETFPLRFAKTLESFEEWELVHKILCAYNSVRRVRVISLICCNISTVVTIKIWGNSVPLPDFGHRGVVSPF